MVTKAPNTTPTADQAVVAAKELASSTPSERVSLGAEGATPAPAASAPRVPLGLIVTYTPTESDRYALQLVDTVHSVSCMGVVVAVISQDDSGAVVNVLVYDHKGRNELHQSLYLPLAPDFPVETLGAGSFVTYQP